MCYGTLDVRCVSSVSETWLDTCVYPVYLTVTRLLAMVCVSSVSEMRPETQCTWCIRRPPSVYLTSRVLYLLYIYMKLQGWSEWGVVISRNFTEITTLKLPSPISIQVYWLGGHRTSLIFLRQEFPTLIVQTVLLYRYSSTVCTINCTVPRVPW